MYPLDHNAEEALIFQCDQAITSKPVARHDLLATAMDTQTHLKSSDRRRSLQFIAIQILKTICSHLERLPAPENPSDINSEHLLGYHLSAAVLSILAEMQIGPSHTHFEPGLLTPIAFTNLCNWAVFLSTLQSNHNWATGKNISAFSTIEFAFLYVCRVLDKGLSPLMLHHKPLMLLLTELWVNDSSVGRVRTAMLKRGQFVSPVLAAFEERKDDDTDLKLILAAVGFESIVSAIYSNWRTDFKIHKPSMTGHVPGPMLHRIMADEFLIRLAKVDLRAILAALHKFDSIKLITKRIGWLMSKFSGDCGPICHLHLFLIKILCQSDHSNMSKALDGKLFGILTSILQPPREASDFQNELSIMIDLITYQLVFIDILRSLCESTGDIRVLASRIGQLPPELTSLKLAWKRFERGLKFRLDGLRHNNLPAVMTQTCSRQGCNVCICYINVLAT